MLTSATRTFMRRCTVAPKMMRPAQFASMSTEAATVADALKFSGYSEIDFTIKEDAKVYDAVQKFAAFNIGCLVVTDAAGECPSRGLSLSQFLLLSMSEKRTALGIHNASCLGKCRAIVAAHCIVEPLPFFARWSVFYFYSNQTLRSYLCILFFLSLQET